MSKKRRVGLLGMLPLLDVKNSQCRKGTRGQFFMGDGDISHLTGGRKLFSERLCLFGCLVGVANPVEQIRRVIEPLEVEVALEPQYYHP